MAGDSIAAAISTGWQIALETDLLLRFISNASVVTLNDKFDMGMNLSCPV